MLISPITKQQPEHWERLPIVNLASIMPSGGDSASASNPGDIMLVADHEGQCVRVLTGKTEAVPGSVILRPNPASPMKPDLLVWQLGHPATSRTLYAIVCSPVSRRPSWQRLSGMVLAVPPPDEQDKILQARAKTVDPLRGIIENQRRLISSMERFAESISTALLIGGMDQEQARDLVRQVVSPMSGRGHKPGKKKTPKP